MTLNEIILFSESFYFVNPQDDLSCRQMVNAYAVSNMHECSQIASKRLQKLGQAVRFVMEVNKANWPAGCVLSKTYKTVWWNRNGLQHGTSEDNFNRICKYRKKIIPSNLISYEKYKKF